MPKCQALVPPDPTDSVILVCSSRFSICLYLLLAGKKKGWCKADQGATRVLIVSPWSLPKNLANTHQGCNGGLGFFRALSHFFMVLPTLSLLSQCALNSSESSSINTKELLGSEEHISSVQRTSAILSKLKESCATTLGFQNRCPAGKEKVKLLSYIKCTFIFLVHWLTLIDKPWCYCSESSKRLYL